MCILQAMAVNMLHVGQMYASDLFFFFFPLNIQVSKVRIYRQLNQCLWFQVGGSSYSSLYSGRGMGGSGSGSGYMGGGSSGSYY